MSRLLVDTPTGAQELISIGTGGSYFDSSRVVWDERTDGPLPSITLGGMVRQGNTLVFSAARKSVHDAALAAAAQDAQAAIVAARHAWGASMGLTNSQTDALFASVS